MCGQIAAICKTELNDKILLNKILKIKKKLHFKNFKLKLQNKKMKISKKIKLKAKRKG